MLNGILFVLGLVLLIKGAGFLVDGASSIARRLHVSELVIGLTIVAFGTSTPELFVNITASLKGNTDIAIGNILGSNISNILLILGISSLIYPLRVGAGTAWKEIPLNVLAALVLGIMANDILLDGAGDNTLSRSDGLVLLAFMAIFMAYIFSIAKNGSVVESSSEKTRGIPASLALVASGLLLLVLGGIWIVDGAVALAQHIGASETLIGLTVVAVGTSLPELATSAVAAYKKNADIAIGNIVGSNIFNIFWILGVSAAIRPLPFQAHANADIGMVAIATVALFAFLFIGKRHELKRWQGAVFVFCYAAYIVFSIQRG